MHDDKDQRRGNNSENTSRLEKDMNESYEGWLKEIRADEIRREEISKPLREGITRYALLGCIAGICVYFFGKWVEGEITLLNKVPHLAGMLLVELGTGLFVAGIAVFGYEYFKHISGMVSTENEQRVHLRLLERAVKANTESTQGMIVASDAMRNAVNITHNLEENLKKVVGDEVLAEKILRFVRSLEEIPGGSEEARQYIAFLGDMVDDVRINAETLQGLCSSIKEKDYNGRPYEFKMPDTRTIAGRLLRAQINTLGTSGCYDSVANVLFYVEGRMSTFNNAAREACRRGVKIRRIFNVCNFEKDRRLHNTERVSAACNIINAHLAIQSELNTNRCPGGYEIKFFHESLIPNIRTEYDKNSFSYLSDLAETYFGLFYKTDQADFRLFLAKDPKRAAAMSLSFCGPDNPSRNIFDEMWEVSTTENPFRDNKFTALSIS